jgi:hypothetical protein
MKTSVIIALLLLSLPVSNIEAAEKKTASSADQAASVAYISQKEASWAAQSVTNDDLLLREIIAEDYIGVSSSSKVMRKSDQIAEAVDGQKGPSDFLSNKLDYVDVHFFGKDLAVAQGAESWELRSGEHGRYIWTDTWLRRKGRWQIIASQDTRLPPSK